MTFKTTLLIIIIIFVSGCAAQSNTQEASKHIKLNQPQTNQSAGDLSSTAYTDVIAKRAQAFFEVYANRTDFEAFLAFYSPDIVLEDLVFGERVIGEVALRSFYRWDKGEVKLLQTRSLDIYEQLISGNKVVTRGVFKPFVYHQQTLGPWRFVIWQEFDEHGLIIRQYDWINYTPKEMFVDGENLNPTALE